LSLLGDDPDADVGRRLPAKINDFVGTRSRSFEEGERRAHDRKPSCLAAPDPGLLNLLMDDVLEGPAPQVLVL
jgi:hypothetical protein